MRLIDADKLPAACNVAIINGKIELDGWIAAKRITEAPTVEAIPVEWIEKWFSQFYGEQGLEWNRCKRFMLEDWEKENGNIQDK